MGAPIGTTEEFATGFGGTAANLLEPLSIGRSESRKGPMDLIFISDDRGGRIYRVLYVGNRGS